MSLVVVVCHVLILLVYLGGGIVTDYVRREYAHGISSVVGYFLEAWFGWATLHRAVMEWIVLQRRKRK